MLQPISQQSNVQIHLAPLFLAHSHPERDLVKNRCRENNDRRADFRGIEVKCKQVKETRGHGGKINLFQQAPRWEEKLSGLARLRLIGQPDEHGHNACHSQVITTANNLGLLLDPSATPEQLIC
jgi:hypothetical protein